MTACASLSPVVGAGVDAYLSPIVLIDGVPERRLAPIEFRTDGLMDRRTALLAVATDEPTAVQDVLRQHWNGALVTLAMPLRLNDGQTQWAVLAHGRLRNADVTLADGRDEQQLELLDQWNTLLDAPVASAWWQTVDGIVFEESSGAVLRTGDRANRSTDTWPIGGATVHVLQSDGQAWTVGTALATLSAWAGLALSTDLVRQDVLDAPLLTSVDLSKPVGDSLTRILEPYGLVFQRDLWRQNGRISEQRTVRPIERGRRVRLAWAGADRALGQVLSIEADRPTPASQMWVATADGWIVESTFDLQAGWDPALAGEADATYSRTGNADFATYANVFRLWVLNEDGRFSNEPFNLGEPFDLTAFFGQGPIHPRPLRLLSALTLNEAGNRRPALVESSTDGGQTWSSYPGIARILSDRAAVYLDDQTLPAAFLAAAQSGDARIRVTAALASPVANQAVRWHGNPFTGVGPAIEFDLRDAFGFKRVAAQSVNYAAVQSGDLSADEVDETRQLADWLVARMQRPTETVNQRRGRARLTLAGCWPLLRVGDRLLDAGQGGADPAGRAEAIAARGAIATSLRCRWPRSADQGAQPAETTIELIF